MMAELKNNYFQSVYDVTSLIPKGRVSTYGAIADYLSLGSARMVGWALNQAHTSDQDVPAHRVINRKGELSGRMHFQTPTIMQEKLEAEGIEVVDHKVVYFKELNWHPEEIEF